MFTHETNQYRLYRITLRATSCGRVQLYRLVKAERIGFMRIHPLKKTIPYEMGSDTYLIWYLVSVARFDCKSTFLKQPNIVISKLLWVSVYFLSDAHFREVFVD